MIKEGKCADCGKWVSKNMAWTSFRNFGKKLCFDCQTKLKVKQGRII